MKKKNQEVLRTALNEFQDAYRVFLDDEVRMQEAEERGIRGQVSPTSPYSYQEWQIKLDILEMTVEQVLQDER
jgi:hypothetical protein|uniref:hypothetical protein n=1 Tax=Candidatus Cryptobacteroides bacterium TaxID=3085639 RepID=UPI004025E753